MNASVRARWAVGMLASALVISLVKPLMLLDPGAFSRTAINRFTILEYLVFLGSAVAWLVWQYDANRVLHRAGVQGMTFTPASSVWWWFVPFANLVQPVRAINELWKASDFSAGEYEWRRLPISPLVVLWWAAFIVERLAILPGIGNSDVDEYLAAESLSNLFSVIGATLAIAIVIAIDRRIRAGASIWRPVSPVVATARAGVMPSAALPLSAYPPPARGSAVVEFPAEEPVAPPPPQPPFATPPAEPIPAETPPVEMHLAETPPIQPIAAEPAPVPSAPAAAPAPPQPAEPAATPSKGMNLAVVALIVGAIMLCAGIAGGAVVAAFVTPTFREALKDFELPKFGDGGSGGGGSVAKAPEPLRGQIAFQGSGTSTGDLPKLHIYLTDAIDVAAGTGGLTSQLTDDPSQDFLPSWSPDGSKIAFSRADLTSGELPTADLYLMNSDGTGQRPIMTTPEFELGSVFSPDGNTLLTTVGSLDGQVIEVWAYQADGSGRTRLTNNDVLDNSPAWSPDGDKIVYSNGKENALNLHVMNADGSQDRQLTSEGLNDLDPVWSPDGKSIAFARGRYDQPERSEVYVIDPDGTGLRRVTNGGTPGWSPEGGWIVFNRLGNLYVIRSDGTQETQVTDEPGNETNPVWRPR